MAPFFQSQLDYIFFFYGLSFLLMAEACFAMRRANGQILPWGWLGLFGLIHGANEWLELLSNSIPNTPNLDAFLAFMLAASFVALAEFGRQGVIRVTGKGPGRWIFIPLLLLAASGWHYGLPGLGSTIRYFLGFVGGAWATTALSLAGLKQDRQERGQFVLAGTAMGLYAFAAGVVVQPAPFFPASLINKAAFFETFGFPIQLLRGGLAICIAVAIMVYSRKLLAKAAISEYSKKASWVYWPLVSVFSIVLLGWFGIQGLGDYGGGEAIEDMEAQVRAAASAILPETVNELSLNPMDTSSPAFVRANRRLRAIKSVDQNIQSAYIIGLKDGSPVLLADDRPDGSAAYPLPSDELVDSRSALTNIFIEGKGAVYGPHYDSRGTWLIGAGPILDPATGKTQGFLCMQVKAVHFLDKRSLYRLFGIAMTLALSVLTLAFFAAWQRSRELAARGAALELAEIRLVEEKKLQVIASALAEGVFVLDKEARLIFINPEAERLLGWTEAEIIGRDMHDIIHKQNADGSPVSRDDCPCLKTLVTGETHRVEDIVYTRKDGSTFPAANIAAPIVEGGKVAGVVSTFQDITDRRKLERQKDDFYAMVTHDLKSPLTIILGYAEMILDEKSGKLDNETLEMTAAIRQSCKRLFSLAEDFLTISGLESGGSKLHVSSESVADIIADIQSETSAAVHKKNLGLKVSLAEGLPRVPVNRTYLSRALLNLMHNAVNYTPPGGGITVRAEKASRDGREYLVLSVSDTGPGIPAEEQALVFEKYYRSPMVSEVKGSGLGLAIVKAVAAAHGGWVELESSEGTGSTFRVFIPAKPA